MKRLSRLIAFLAAPAAVIPLSACRNLPVGPRPPAAASVLVEEGESWQSAASPGDAEKIGRLGDIWSEALGEARQAGFGRRLSAEGSLLQPGAALPRAAPPPGAYLCRAIRLGLSTPRARAFAAGRQGFCYVGVEGDQLSLSIEAGSDRAGGYLWEEKGGRRAIFLGASARQKVRTLPAYGDDPVRDLAGVVERVGNFRYRLAVPGSGAKLTVFELIPAPRQ